MTFMGRRVRRKDVPRLVIMGAAVIVVVTFLAALCSTLYGIHEVRGDIRDCNEAIAQKQGELKQLEQKKKYYESDEFFEDAVRDGGYVGDDETVFVITN